jgi:hypothetical protein
MCYAVALQGGEPACRQACWCGTSPRQAPCAVGMAKLGCDSLDKLKAKLPSLRAEMEDADKFRQIYIFAYLFSRCADWAR